MWTLPVSSVEAVSSAGAASSVLVSSVLVSSVLVSSVVVLSVFSVAGAVLLAQATRPSSITRASSKHTTFFIQTSNFEIHLPDWGRTFILPVFFILSTNSCAGFRESARNPGVLKSRVRQSWAHFSVFPIEYSVFVSRTQVFPILFAHERHYIFSCVYINTLTQYSRSTANRRLAPKNPKHVASSPR